jgi:hypothetical protein
MQNNYFNTPPVGFSKFRELIDKWDHFCMVQEAEQSVHELLDKHGLILFFKKDDGIFGAPEESRLVFAKLKNDDPKDDDPMMPGFRDEAKFLGINLLKSMFGSPDDSVQSLFGNSDIPKIHVCDRDEIVKILMNHDPEKKPIKKESKKKTKKK